MRHPGGAFVAHSPKKRRIMYKSTLKMPFTMLIIFEKYIRGVH